MSVTLVFLPGIFGSELQLPDGEVVWPPTLGEFIGGYGRITELESPELISTRIIPNVACFKFYSPIQSLFQQLGFGGSATKQLIEHHYDWRLDIFDLADNLADRLDTIETDEIILVAHSMGGLVTRLVLETGTYHARPFFQRISKFIALATPHNGAPLALARVMGLDKAYGISAADLKRLAENVKYPSGYQLLPAPGEDACWDTRLAAELAPLDYYDPQVATRLGMKPSQVARAKALHDALRAGNAPANVRYFYFSGAGHKTATRVNINGNNRDIVFTPDAGDGTVPMWSALPRPEQKQVVINEHANVFRGLPFKRVFFRLLGGNAGAPLIAMQAMEAKAAELNPLQISLQKAVFNSGDLIEVVIASETPITKLQGQLVFDRLTEGDEIETKGEFLQDISYVGPGVYSLALSIEAGLEPGFYELRFEGDRPISQRMVFAVSK